MKSNKVKTAGWFALSAILVIIDQLSKGWASGVLKDLRSLPLIEGVVGLRYAENTGAAFSSFSGATYLLIAFSLAVCAAVAVHMLRHPEETILMQQALALVLAGGVGNLIDRIRCGYVVDFIELQFIDFAIFNAADIFITSGAVLLFIVLLLGGERNARMDR